jgi:hypothetical protein
MTFELGKEMKERMKGFLVHVHKNLMENTKKGSLQFHFI